MNDVNQPDPVPPIEIRKLSRLSLPALTIGAFELQPFFVDLKPSVQQVSELSGLLYSQFQFPNGEIKLSGCQLTSRLMVAYSKVDVQNVKVCHTFLGSFFYTNHWIVADDLILNRVEDVVDKSIQQLATAPSVKTEDSIEVENLSAEREARMLSAIADLPWHMVPSAANVIFVMELPWIEGKFQFVYQDQAVESPFEGWADLLVQNPARLQPYHCRLTSKSGKQFSVDAEGDIGLKNSMRTCSVSGLVLLESKLLLCSNSQKWAARKFMLPAADGVSFLIDSEVSNCRQCNLPFAKTSLDRKKRCVFCQKLTGRLGISDVSDLLLLNRLVAIDSLKKIVGDLEPEVCAIQRSTHLIWLMYLSHKQQRLAVVDLSGELVAHRQQNSWTKRWSDV